MKRALALVLMLIGVLSAALAHAQTRAWLDRNDIHYGDTVALNIETDQPVQRLDVSPLQASFDVGGQSVRRSFELINGRSSRKTVFSVGLRPRAPGVLTVPALSVGRAMTASLRLTVLPPPVQAAGAHTDVFIETELDTERPYVQQAVGVTVRVNSAVPLLSGQLEQEPPAHATLQRVGEDASFQRVIDGRRYDVVERHFLLIPERSGTLILPGAYFNGMQASGMFDQVFGDGREALSAAAPVKHLQVLPIPANAPQPWLPLRDLKLRYVVRPVTTRVGDAATVTIEAIADGAMAAQVPALEWPAAESVQVFANPPRSEETFVDGRPVARVQRSFSIVPKAAGTITLAAPGITWWDAQAGVAKTTRLPALHLQIASAPAGAVSQTAPPATAAAPVVPITTNTVKPRWSSNIWRGVGGLGVLALALGWVVYRRANAAVPDNSPKHPRLPTLAHALQSGDLNLIAQVLAATDALAATLDNADQRAAIHALQAARWGAGDPQHALALLRAAFASGVQSRPQGAHTKSVLDPLYPK